MRENSPLLWGAFLACGGIVLTAPVHGAGVDFQKQIAPLLSEHCLRCHSEGNSQGELSLTTDKHLRAKDYLAAGNAAESYLMDVVTSREGKPAAMPKEAPPLTEQQVGLLREWINAGAEWPEGLVLREKSKADASWWSLQPVRELHPPTPEGIPDSWDRNPIDRFVFAKLAEHGLQPSLRAEPRILMRRLSFDVLGLPPAPEDLVAFERDADARAYAAQVERLLDSPHRGERLAQHWLDIVHYADTHGYERDQRRDHAWRYRDYVIRAFNQDKPYNLFLKEQIAGDVLEPKSAEAVIATGFLAAGPWDFVGQVETKSPELRRAARALDLDDMVTQVMTSTIAMTINCARCHDHKLDPISQREYYQLWAVFADLKREHRVVDPEDQKRYQRDKANLEQQLAEIRRQLRILADVPLDLADVVGGGDGFGSGKRGQGIDPRTGRTQQAAQSDLTGIRPGEFTTCEHKFIDGVFIPSAGRSLVSSTGLLAQELPFNSGKAWDAIRNGPVTSQFSTKWGDVDYNAAGHSLLGLHANAGITFDLAEIRSTTGRSLDRFYSVVGYGGRLETPSANFWVLLDGELVHASRLGRLDAIEVSVPLPEQARFLTLISTDGENGYAHDQISFGDPRIEFRRDVPGKPEAEQARLRLRQEQAALESRLRELQEPAMFYGVSTEASPPVHILRRGDPESPGEQVRPGRLNWGRGEAVFAGEELSDAERRLALVDWIVDPQHPLTARVIVNRLWSWHFGRGLVETPSDFGYGGGRPSHPELLDWLAAELVRANWSLKHIQRLILTSQTYQMTSRGEPPQAGNSVDPLQIDRDNRLLWRMNARRLDAEVLRDSVLAITGLLNREMHGPGYRDFEYQEAYAPVYVYKTADRPELWRRSIYRFVVRTTPNRFLTTLDCPDPANLTPRRHVTTTPLQSLALYNNDFMLQQSQYLRERLEREAGAAVAAQVERAFWLVLGRPVTARESELSKNFVEQHGLFAFCRSLLNTNEFVYVD